MDKESLIKLLERAAGVVVLNKKANLFEEHRAKYAEHEANDDSLSKNLDRATVLYNELQRKLDDYTPTTPPRPRETRCTSRSSRRAS